MLKGNGLELIGSLEEKIPDELLHFLRAGYPIGIAVALGRVVIDLSEEGVAGNRLGSNPCMVALAALSYALNQAPQVIAGLKDMAADLTEKCRKHDAGGGSSHGEEGDHSTTSTTPFEQLNDSDSVSSDIDSSPSS